MHSVLVLGADWFVGRRIADALSASGLAVPVRGIGKRPVGRALAPDERVVDPCNTDSVRAAMQGIDCMVNCISGNAARVLASTRAIFSAAAAASPPPAVIHLSSMSVYGSASGLIAEDAPLSGDLGAYSAARIAAEKVAAEYSRSVIFRLGCEFGPGAEYWGAGLAQCLMSRRLGNLGAAGDGCCNIVDADDIAQAVIHTVADPSLQNGIFNLCNPEASTWNEFLTRFAIALGAVPVKRLSERHLRFELRLRAVPSRLAAELARRLGSDPRRLPAVITPSLAGELRQEIRLDTSRIERALGMQWKSVDQSLRETASWFLEAQNG
jgi:nucleoside-diphosphate-sugar epimerase